MSENAISWFYSVTFVNVKTTLHSVAIIKIYSILTLTLPLDLKSPMTSKLNYDGHVGRI